VRPRIFQRSFSTKASRGRGLGTYGMKLFGERHLGGRVSFTTGEAEGTVFAIELPRPAPPAG
jgi:signal transduction histidine kinase